MNKFFIALIMLGAFGSETALAAKKLYDFSYRVKLPVYDKVDCNQAAGLLAARFTAATADKTQDVTATCQTRQTVAKNNTSYAVDILVVSYRAEAAVTSYRAEFSAPVLSAKQDSAVETFATYQDCLNALPGQAATYTTQTTLPVVAAYCQAPDLDRGFMLEIEGFGTPKNKFFSFQNTLVVDSAIAPYIPHVINVIKGLGGVITYQDAARVFYYSPTTLPIQTNAYLLYSMDECTDQTAELSRILAGFGHDNIATFCSQTDENLYYLDAVSAGTYSVNNDDGLNSPKYSTYQECQLDRPRMLAMAKSHGQNVVGALCLVGTAVNSYALRLFTLTR